MRLEGSSEAGTGWAGRCLSTTFALALHGAVVIAVAVWQNLSFKPPPPPVYFEIISEVAYQSLFPTPEPEPTLDPEPELELEPEPEPEPEPESEVESEPEPEQFLPESTNPAIVAMETPPSKPTPPQIEPTPRQVEPRMHVKVINVNSSPASYNTPLPLPSAAPLYTPPNGQAAYLHNPKPIYPNDKILATSVGARDIIKKSKICENIDTSIKNIDYVIATSARFRNKNIKHIKLTDLKKIDFTKKVAFLFGSEASGLSNNEISYANYTLQIPTNPDFKSLNLSHSLIIVAQYVASIIRLKSLPFKRSNKVKPASKKDIQSMVNLCVVNLDQINFFKPREKKPIMLENLRNIFYKMDLSDKETRILSSVFASLGKKR